ncbi:HGGxSTG domain-containing protein [Mycobacterium sp. B14F4]|uniref:HGGxSTG domain-containing protein n=1 Tax=Mycobacterium sp. B14F4 TaxID=3153565 RepID=UPI00325CAAEF
MTDRVTDIFRFRNAPSKKCTAHSKRTGAPCNNPPVTGLSVCRMHGGATKAAKNAARRRIDLAADKMAEQLLRIADSAESEAVKLAAVKDALDRAGLKAPDKVEVDVGVKPYEKLLGDVVGIAQMTRDESRRQRGLSESAALESAAPTDSATSARSDGEIVDAEIVDEGDRQPANGGTEQRPARPAGMRTDDGRGNGPGRELMTLEEAQALANEANQRAGVYGRRRR